VFCVYKLYHMWSILKCYRSSWPWTSLNFKSFNSFSFVSIVLSIKTAQRNYNKNSSHIVSREEVNDINYQNERMYFNKSYEYNYNILFLLQFHPNFFRLTNLSLLFQKIQIIIINIHLIINCNIRFKTFQIKLLFLCNYCVRYIIYMRCGNTNTSNSIHATKVLTWLMKKHKYFHNDKIK
jgi:hypothetical protein